METGIARCPKCDHKKWEVHPRIHRLIALEKNEDDANLSKHKGTDVTVNKCENCGYVELYWEPDRKESTKKS